MVAKKKPRVLKKIGRPLKYESAEELEAILDQYFVDCDAGRDVQKIVGGQVVVVREKIPYTITGLALSADLSRRQLIEYSDRSDKDARFKGFNNTLKRAKARVEADYELGLRTRGNAGDIFGLKNFGWTDQSKMELTGANGTPLVPIDTITTEERAILRGIAQDYAAKLISGD